MKVVPPKHPALAQLKPVAIAQLTDEASFERVHIAGNTPSVLHATGLALDEVIIERVTLHSAQLEKLGLMDATLKACDFSTARCAESSFIRVQCIGGRMVGVDLSRCTLKDVVFKDCKLNMANFRFSKLVNVQFVNCILHEADFQAAELRHVTFVDSELKKVEFGQCTVHDVDARTSLLYDLRGWDALKGLTISAEQVVAIAPELAIHLGIVVKD